MSGVYSFTSGLLSKGIHLDNADLDMIAREFKYKSCHITSDFQCHHVDLQSSTMSQRQVRLPRTLLLSYR